MQIVQLAVYILVIRKDAWMKEKPLQPHMHKEYMYLPRKWQGICNAKFVIIGHRIARQQSAVSKMASAVITAEM